MRGFAIASSPATAHVSWDQSRLNYLTIRSFISGKYMATLMYEYFGYKKLPVKLPKFDKKQEHPYYLYLKELFYTLGLRFRLNDINIKEIIRNQRVILKYRSSKDEKKVYLLSTSTSIIFKTRSLAFYSHGHGIFYELLKDNAKAIKNLIMDKSYRSKSEKEDQFLVDLIWYLKKIGILAELKIKKRPVDLPAK